MDETMGGEVVCYLGQLDETGAQIDPRDRVRLASGVGDDGTCLRIPITRGGPFEELVLGVREGIEHYRERLEEPACRTAAWQIVLLAEEQPVVIVPEEWGPGDQAAQTLLQYLRDLMT